MTRGRKIIIFAALAISLGGAAVYFLSRDSGPPVRVFGNFTAKDVAQIKHVVRRRLWHDAFPGLSLQNLKALPGSVKRAWTTPVDSIFDYEHGAMVTLSGPALGNGTNYYNAYVLTNGPAGWAWKANYFYVVPD